MPKVQQACEHTSIQAYKTELPEGASSQGVTGESTYTAYQFLPELPKKVKCRRRYGNAGRKLGCASATSSYLCVLSDLSSSLVRPQEGCRPENTQLRVVIIDYQSSKSQSEGLESQNRGLLSDVSGARGRGALEPGKSFQATT